MYVYGERENEKSQLNFWMVCLIWMVPILYIVLSLGEYLVRGGMRSWPQWKPNTSRKDVIQVLFFQHQVIEK